MDIDRRHELTFEQAEGVAALPTQMALRTLSRSVRARLFAVFHERLDRSAKSMYVLNTRALAVLKDYHVQHLDGFVDSFSQRPDFWVPSIRAVFERGNYAEVLGLAQFWLRHPSRDDLLPADVENVLRQTQAAYRVVDSRTIAPITSEANAKAITRDLAAVELSGFEGAKAHLSAAAEELSRGDFPGSVRESIHAVDAVARKLSPGTTDLGPALTALSNAGYVHGAMTQGFRSLYGYASNEKGIRHALLDDPKANVTEADALYMFGACAAFCAYLTSKAREFGLNVD